MVAIAWTALGNNFNVNGFGKLEFSGDNAIRHLQSLEPKGGSAAAEYV